MPTKVIKAQSNSEAFIKVADSRVSLAANSDSYIDITDQGIHISGPVAIHTSRENVRYNGLFTDIPGADFAHLMASSIVTPIPSSTFSPPIKGLLGILGTTALFTALILISSAIEST